MSELTPKHVDDPECLADALARCIDLSDPESALSLPTEPTVPPPTVDTSSSAVELVLDDSDLLACILVSLPPRALGRCALLSKRYWDTCMSEERWLQLRRAQRLRQVPFDPMGPRMESRAKTVVRPEGYNLWAWAYRCAQTQEELDLKHLVWIVGRPTKEWLNGSPDWPAVTQSTSFDPSLGTSSTEERATVKVRVVRCPEISSMIRVAPMRLVGWEAGLAFWRSHDGAPFASTRVFLESEGRATARSAAVEECLAQLAVSELPDEDRPWFGHT